MIRQSQPPTMPTATTTATRRPAFAAAVVALLTAAFLPTAVAQTQEFRFDLAESLQRALRPNPAAATVGSQGFRFDLTKRSNAVRLVPKGGGYALTVEQWEKSTDKTTVSTRVAPLTRAPGSNPGRFTLVSQGKGSEIRLDLTQLPARYLWLGPNMSAGMNEGDWAMAVSGRGPAYEKLRRDLVGSRFGEAWKGNGDLTFHGSASNF